MSRPVTVHIVHAFITPGGGGNPAGIVLDADHLSAAQKQRVAAQVGLSETAFVSRSTRADIKLEFFTPQRQIAHCGHATIATFSLLVQTGRLQATASSKETIDGCRDILLDGTRVFMEQRAPRYRALSETTVSPQEVRRSLGLSEHDLTGDGEPMIVDTGNAFLLVPVRSASALRALRPDQAHLLALSDTLDLIGFYPFTLGTSGAGRHAAARMFAPRYGIAEEAATGMAAGPLGAYLHDVVGVQLDVLRIEQGEHMTPPSPSELEVRLERSGGRVQRLMVGGQARETAVITVDSGPA